MAEAHHQAIQPAAISNAPLAIAHGIVAEDDSLGAREDDTLRVIEVIEEKKEATKLLKLLHCYPISRILCSYLSISNISALRAAGRDFVAVIDHLLRMRLNIQLQHFVKDPNRLRSQLSKHGALISGVFALEFFEQGRQTQSDLDIFVEDGTHADEFRNYLCGSEGYELEATTVNRPADQVKKITYLVLHRNSSWISKVRVISTSGAPIRAILLGSYTTASVNFITWNKAYAIFPKPTFIHHKFCPLRPLNDNFGSHLREYQRQGWTPRDMVWPDLTEDSKDPLRINRHRRVGDRFSLIIQLDDSGIEKSSTPDFVIEHNQFTVGVSSSRSALATSADTYSISAASEELSSLVLQYRYMFADDSDKSWRSYAEKRLNRNTIVELWKLKPDERSQQVNNILQPPNPGFGGFPANPGFGFPANPGFGFPQNRGFGAVRPNLSSLAGDFEKPETWDYYDDQIPKWYQEWESRASNARAA